jgi:hypothetical protein
VSGCDGQLIYKLRRVQSARFLQASDIPRLSRPPLLQVDNRKTVPHSETAHDFISF